MGHTRREEERKRIGRRIAELRAQKGITLRKLEELTGIRNNHISRVEKGSYSVGFDTLQTIGEALGYDIDFVARVHNNK